MPYQVVIKAEANADVAAAYEYYEDKQPGLGESFLKAFEARCHDLSENPLITAISLKTLKKCCAILN